MKAKKRKVVERLCRVCGVQFKPRDNLKAGKYCSHECYWKDMKENRLGELSNAWRGKEVSYAGIHKWIGKNFKRLNECEFCGEVKKTEWANISGEYLRVPGDWIGLCHRCHNIWDRNSQKAWRTRSGKKARILCAIDFDGPICYREGILREHDFRNCLPAKEAIDSLWWMVSIDIEYYILTARPPSEWRDIVFWLHSHNFPGTRVTNIKKLGTKLIIDDRAVRFTNWRDICKYVG